MFRGVREDDGSNKQDFSPRRLGLILVWKKKVVVELPPPTVALTLHKKW